MERKIILVFSLAIATACATGASGQSAIDQLGATRPPPASAPHCVTCGARISLTKGCPNCNKSRVQKPKPQPSPSHVGPYMPFPGPGNMYRQPVQRQSDDRLYYDGIETRGGLKTRHFDPDGLAARAEKWGQEMRQVDEQTQKKKDALARSLDNDKKDLLEKDGKPIALPQLKNPFANDPNVVDLRHLGNSPGTPDLLNQKQPSDYDILRNGKAPKVLPESADDLVYYSTLAGALEARVNATKDATITLKPYHQEEVEKITTENGWVIAARDLEDTTIKKALKISGKEDNPYGMHWQIMLPNGKNIGYFDGTSTGEDGKVLPNIKSEHGSQYKGIVASGKNGAAMNEAVRNVEAKWKNQYVTDPEGQRYNAGSHNCQDFTGDVLREYQRLLSNTKSTTPSPVDNSN